MVMLSRSRGATERHRPREGQIDPVQQQSDLEKQAFYEQMPPLPIPLDRGRVARQWMEAGARVLDIGCGAGYHVRHFARKAARVAALDVDRVSLRTARQRVRSSRVSFMHYDGRRLPFADASFDTVTMLDVLEHVADRQSMIEEIARVLKPGGTWVVSVPYRGAVAWLSPENMSQDYPRAFRWLSRWTRVRFWIRDHMACGMRHKHFSRSDLKQLASASFQAERWARRGSLLYALAYLGLCFPPPLFGRLWASACFALMALDYQVAYGPCAYNLIMRFRRKAHSRFDWDPTEFSGSEEQMASGRGATELELAA
jgi:2-polyprenyl-3-methyl-5-hydroxy-6-metoxy-1,4-benzoquinol methylase